MVHGSKPLKWLLLFLVFSSTMAFAQHPVEQTGRALDELNRWMGDNENARNWKKFLRVDDLVAQLAKGSAADRREVAAIRTLFAGTTPGLKRPSFVAVRNALDSWLAALPVPLADLPAAARSERDHFQPVSPARVATARRTLDAAMGRLDRFLAGSRPENADAWKKYLRRDALSEQLAKQPTPAELQAIAELYAANEKGLELPYFADVRRALQAYAYDTYFSQGNQAKEAYAQHLDEIAKRLESYSQSTHTEDAAAIGRSLGWLERGGQTPNLISSVRRSFERPNLYMEISERLIASSVETDEVRARLNRPLAVRDNILRTSIRGTAYPSLEMRLFMVPNNERGAFDVRLAGAATSSSIGTRGSVTVYTTGYTSIDATNRIYFDERGLVSVGSSASCSTSTNINDINARCGLIERLAWNQAGKSKGQAESIASAHAERRIEGQLSSEVAERLAKANESYSQRVRNRLMRRDGFPRQFNVKTTDQTMILHILHATPQQLSTTSSPPELAAGQDMSLRLHESFVMNMGESLLGGLRLTDERLVELLEESEAEVPEELKITDDKDPWSITFSQERPVSVSFTGNTVKFAIRGRRFTRGDQEVRAIMDISATYLLEKSGNGSKLTRQGDVVAEYVNRERQSSGEIAMKTILRKKFAALFKPEINSEGLKLPEQLRGAGQLQLVHLLADQGWLSLAWKRSTEDRRVAKIDAR